MITKKKALFALPLAIISAAMLLSGCASFSQALSIESLISPVSTFFGNIFGGSSPAIEGLVSLDEAFDAVAAELEANITAGYEVAVYKITASREEIGDFLAEDLSDRLAARKKLIPLAREAALRNADKEHQFQMSGLVSDESAVSIGHYLGAKVVITGDFLITADFSQLRVRAVDVRTSAILGASPAVLVNNNDPIVKNFMASFGIIPTPRVTENALDHLNRGKDLYMEGKLDAAIEEFGRALATDKKLVEAYYHRGASYYFKHDYNKAIADYTQAIRLNPNFADAYYNRGVVYFNKDYLDRAIEDFSQAIRLNPNGADLYYSRGYAYDDKGDYDKAIADYTQAIRLDPSYAEAYSCRGISYFNKGDLDRAIADFEAALKIDPNDTDTRDNLEIARKKRGR